MTVAPSLELGAFAFPQRRRPLPSLGAALARRGVGLRAATTEDIPFLRALYGAFRAEELATTPWSEAAKAVFLDSQFALQHRHFTAVFADADFLVVTSEAAPIGRLYLHRRDDAAHVIDIGFEPQWRGRGLGTTLLKQIAADARRAGARAVVLSVATNNPRAYALYARLGFEPQAVEGMHMRMELPLARGRLS